MIFQFITNSIDCMEYRDKMNNALKKANIHNILIIAAGLSKTKNSIIFTVDENNTADQLIEKRTAWKKKFDFVVIHKNELWHEFLVHDIDITIFGSINDMSLLKKIEIFNLLV